jgi:Uma2 family endonuclease
VSTLPKTFLTPEQYLEIERKAEYKSEYFNGEMFAMAGASYLHSLVAANLLADLQLQLRRKPCRILTSDTRVHIPNTGLYTYPDAVVVCGAPQFLENQRPDTLLNPVVVIEVLSPSTEAYDRGRKFGHYQAIESLRQYVMADSDRLHVDVLTRQPDGTWLLRSAGNLQDTIDLDSIACKLVLADIYDKVEFEPTLRP